jgi:hypothetical protein
MSLLTGPNYALIFSPFGVVIGWCSVNSPEGVVPAPQGTKISTPAGEFFKANGGNGNTGWERIGRTFNVTLRAVPIATSGSPNDRASKAIPSGITRWRPVRATILCATAAGTLAAASAGIFTQAAGAGTAIVDATALTPFTGANQVRDLNLGTINTAITDQNIFIRQTVNSGNAGTLDILIQCQDLS